MDNARELEQRILAHEKEIERREKEIAAEEAKILSVDQHIMENIEAVKKQSGFASTLFQHRFLISIVVTLGIVLVWYGIDHLVATLPFVSTGIGALVLGLILLWAINRYASPKN